MKPRRSFLRFKSCVLRAGKDQKGYTLIELLFVVLTIGLIMGGIYSYIRFVFFNYNRNDGYMKASQIASMAIHEMGRELRQATKIDYNPVSLTSTGSTQISFWVPSGLTPTSRAYDDNIVYSLQTLGGRKLLYQFLNQSLASISLTVTGIPMTTNMDFYRNITWTAKAMEISSGPLAQYNDPSIAFDDTVFYWDVNDSFVGIGVAVSAKGFSSDRYRTMLQTTVSPQRMK